MTGLKHTVSLKKYIKKQILFIGNKKIVAVTSTFSLNFIQVSGEISRNEV
jgi:hypothetical protein